jgi:hypothetical protein
MLIRLLDHAALRALMGGVFYALLTTSVNQIAHLAARSIRARNMQRGRPGQGTSWAWVGQVLATIASVGFIFAMLVEGSFAANDVGIAPIDWPTHGPWLAVLVPGTIALIAIFWAPHYSGAPYYPRASRDQAAKGPESASTRVPRAVAGPGSLLHALTEEASLTVFRAASSPLLGSYWGVWFGLAWNLVLRHIVKSRRPGFTSLDRRGAYYLSSFVITGSLWACLLGRILCHVAALLIHHWSIRRRGAVPVSETKLIPSGEEEGQSDEDSEHNSSQDGNALQVP